MYALLAVVLFILNSAEMFYIFLGLLNNIWIFVFKLSRKVLFYSIHWSWCLRNY